MAGAPLSSRLLIGALAGVVGTAAMTAAMNRFHRRLPEPERYPLPPREITQATLAMPDGQVAKDASMAAHFAFGSAAAALLAAPDAGMSMRKGIAGALAVWAVSYFGWVPAARILEPVQHHPVRRTALMIAAHIAWGAVTALTSRELNQSRETVFGSGPHLDRNRRSVGRDGRR